MNESGFREWLEANYALNTVQTKLSEARQLRNAYGDLDALYDQDRLENVMQSLRYTAADKAARRPNPSKLDLRSDLNRDLSGYRTTVNYYRLYREGDAVNGAGGRPDTQAVHKAMDECASMGVDAFLETYHFGRNITYWVMRDGERFPSKAIFGVAYQYMPGGTAQDGENCNGTDARKHLARLGFEVVEADGETASKKDGRPFLLFDAAGAAFQPVRHGERDGRSAFKIKPASASNKADEAITTESLTEVARAMLVDGLAARVKALSGGPVNYIGYGKQKLVRYELDPEIAREIGVPSMGSVDQNSKLQQESREMPDPTNLILYGPPGTGKTYATAAEAVRLCDGAAPAEREALLTRYRELEAEKRIAFVTFHQNYDYETFVEGLRPETGENEGGAAGFRLEARAGIFREICALAEQARTRGAPSAGSAGYDFTGRRFWKMGQGAIGSEDDVYDSAVANDYIALGWGGSIDWSSDRFSTFDAIKAEWLAQHPDDTTPSNWTQTWPFRCEMKVGDIVIVPYGNTAFRAIAEVTDDYRFEPSAEGYYAHRRGVRWLLTLDEPLPLDTIVDGNFTMRTLYSLPSKRVNLPAMARLVAGESDADPAAPSTGAPDQFVLVIDEINRANISKVFGELITLIEPDKRLGMPNALTLTLPYSKKRDFGVPANLHIIGTMNTADRSIALLDTALRRRFRFHELAPDTKVAAFQDAVRETGLPLDAMLDAINDRIEYLVDREHRIGHAFFIGCRTRTDVDAVMRDKVIPLLQEYFFEDWSRVAAVLGEPSSKGGGFLDCRKLKDPTGQDGEVRESWSIRRDFAEDAYRRVAGGTAATSQPGEGAPPPLAQEGSE